VTVPRTPEEFFGSYVPSRIRTVSDELAGKSSAGSVVIRLDEDQPWCFRLRDGTVHVERTDADDAVVRISTSRQSFEPLVVRSAERDEATPTSQRRRQGLVHALTLDAERAALIRNAPGSVAVVVQDGNREHRVVATPGAREMSDAACRIRLGMDEFVDLQAGRAQPLQLMMTGQLVIEGDAQIVMSLFTALSG
jgi:hypothetical protein